MSKRRIVITGVGVVSPNGIGKENVWKGMSGGVSAVAKVDNFDVAKFNTKIAAQALDFDPKKLGLTSDEARRMDRYVQFAVVSAKEALSDSKLDLAKVDKTRMGVALANAICGTKYMEEEFLRVTNNGIDAIDPRKVRADLYDAAMFNTPSSEISGRYGLKGICTTISTGCTAGSDSVGFSLKQLKIIRLTL